METLISLVTHSEAIGATAEELIVAALMATPEPLLQIFSHSAALKRVDEWLAKAAAANDAQARTTQLLALLAKMPMTITSLQVRAARLPDVSCSCCRFAQARGFSSRPVSR